jgi:hypothetical protein
MTTNFNISSKTHKVQYCYTYPNYVEFQKYPGYILCKCGDTQQGLDDQHLLDQGHSAEECAKIRMNQQGGASEAFAKILIHSFIHPIVPGKLERDYQLHEIFLKTNGLRPCDLDGLGREWFYLPYDQNDITPFKTTIDFINDSVQSLIGKKPRTFLKLKKIQEDKIQEVLDKCEDFANDKLSSEELFSMIGILFARFGKTIWTLELFRRLNEKFGFRILILPAHVLSSHTSFKKEIERFEQFRNLEFIDAYEFRNNDQMQEKINLTFKANKLPVVSVSMHATDLEIFKPLHDLPCGEKFVLVDEADRGAWTEKSRKIVNYILN